MANSELEQLIARVGDLPAMPTIAVRIMSMIGDPSTSANKLQDMISRDQALTAKVLKIANSAMFGVSRDITTLSHAIVILGFSTIRSIVLAASTKSIYHRGPSSSSFSTKLLWEHSLATAVIARRIVQSMGAMDLEKAFIAGLLHDIGKSVLNVNFGEAYQEVIGQVYNTGADFLPIEDAVLGFNHTQVGALVMRKWKLSSELEEGVFYHHNPEDATENTELIASVALANEISNKLGIGPTKRPDIDLKESKAAEVLGIDPGEREKLFDKIAQLLEEDKEIFTI